MRWGSALFADVALALFRLVCRGAIALFAQWALELPSEVAFWILAAWYGFRAGDWLVSSALNYLCGLATVKDKAASVVRMFECRGFRVLPECYGLNCEAAMLRTFGHPEARPEDRVFAAQLAGTLQGVALGSFVRGHIAAHTFNAAFSQYRTLYRATQSHDDDYMRESSMHDLLNGTR